MKKRIEVLAWQKLKANAIHIYCPLPVQLYARAWKSGWLQALSLGCLDRGLGRVRDIEVVFCRFFFLWQEAERCNTLGEGGRTCLTLCLTLKIAAPPF